MNWPPIEVPFLGSSGFIALIALLHVPFFVNFVMGAPIIAVIAEWMGARTKNPHYDTLAKSLSAMAFVTVGVGAFGGIALVVSNIGLFPKFFAAGVGIFFWPLLIEVVAFLTEAIFIALYFYTWKSLKHRTSHYVIGLVGGLGAWVSGLIINGLASFMLTPGQWVTTKSVLDAAFNPSALPSYTHRIVASFSITGFFLIMYALWSAWRAKTDADREYSAWALNYSSQWALIATILQVIPGVWYLMSLEAGTAGAAPEGSVVPLFLNGALSITWFGAILIAAVSLLLVWLFGVRNPRFGLKAIGQFALILSVIGILTATAFMGFNRERARKPYLVYGVIYGNQNMVNVMKGIQPTTAPTVAATSQPATTKAATEPSLPAATKPATEATATSQPAPTQAGTEPTSKPAQTKPDEAGEGAALFEKLACGACHAIGDKGGTFGPVLTKIGAKLKEEQLRKIIQTPPQGMPPFSGTAAELDQLVEYLSDLK